MTLPNNASGFLLTPPTSSARSSATLAPTTSNSVTRTLAPPSPTPFITDAFQLIAANSVDHAVIAYPQSPLKQLSHITFITKTGDTSTLTTPNITPFVEAFYQRHIPYRFTAQTPSGAEKAGQFFQFVGEDMVAPLAIMLGMFGLVTLGYNRVKKHQETQETKAVLKDALRQLKGYPAVKDLLTAYDPAIKDPIDRFLNNELPVLIFKGPAGDGKSYLLDSLAQAKQSSNTLVINGQLEAVRNLLSKVYLGTQVESKRAQRLLKQLNQKHPVEHIILTINEFEDYAYEMGQLIKTAVGNTPGMRQNLPTLKILASANSDDLALDPATLNRAREHEVWIDHKPPALLAQMTTNLIHKRFSFTQKDALNPKIEKILATTPGLSTRHIADNIVPNLTGNTETEVLDQFETKVKAASLDPYEIAALVRQQTLDRFFEMNVTQANPQAKPGLNQQLWPAAETMAADKLKHLKGNGQFYHQLFDDIWKALNSDTNSKPFRVSGGEKLSLTALKPTKAHLTALLTEVFDQLALKAAENVTTL